MFANSFQCSGGFPCWACRSTSKATIWKSLCSEAIIRSVSYFKWEDVTEGINDLFEALEHLELLGIPFKKLHGNSTEYFDSNK